MHDLEIPGQRVSFMYLVTNTTNPSSTNTFLCPPFHVLLCRMLNISVPRAAGPRPYAPLPTTSHGIARCRPYTSLLPQRSTRSRSRLLKSSPDIRLLTNTFEQPTLTINGQLGSFIVQKLHPGVVFVGAFRMLFCGTSTTLPAFVPPQNNNSSNTICGVSTIKPYTIFTAQWSSFAAFYFSSALI
jgi:hypothetical protein